MSQLIIIIGRGHSGQSVIAKTLDQSGVYMGDVNTTWDLIPPEPLYEAVRIFGQHVKYLGDLRWNFGELADMPIPEEFTRLMAEYVQSVTASNASHKGWKIPEATLAYPWIVRMFPEAYYINWVRDPRDAILTPFANEQDCPATDMGRFGFPYPETGRYHWDRGISWKFLYDIVVKTPKPEHCLYVEFEDFVLHQEGTLAKLERFLGFPLEKIPIRPNAVGRWRMAEGFQCPEFLEEYLGRWRY